MRSQSKEKVTTVGYVDSTSLNHRPIMRIVRMETSKQIDVEFHPRLARTRKKKVMDIKRGKINGNRFDVDFSTSQLPGI